MSISPNRRRAILAAHGGVCFYCGGIDAQHVDHIVPRSFDGTDDLGNLIASCLPCNLRKFRHRLPPDAEQRALAEAEAMRHRVLEIERATGTPPERRRYSGRQAKTVKINVMVTAEELKMLDDARIENRVRSMSAFCRTLIRGQLIKRGKLPA